MPNWKKVIVSGSNASLNSLTVSNGITGSLFGTASYASNSDLLDGLNSTVFATTGSNRFNGNQTITGSLIVSGIITGLSLRIENNTHLDGQLRVTNDAQFDTHILIQGAQPHLKLRDTSGGGFSSGYDIRIDTGSFEIHDDTHDRNVLSDFFNVGTGKHTTSLTSEIIVISGSDSVTVLGPLDVTSGITGSLFGTASYASNSDLLDGLNSTVFATTGSNTFTGAQIISSSLTVFTGSAIEFQVLNTGVKIGNLITDAHSVTGSLNISGSVTATSLTVSGSTGTLFSSNVDTLILTGSMIVTGSSVITGSLSVGISTILANRIAASSAGSNAVFTQATGSFTGAKYLYTVTSASNARTGEVMAVWNGTTVQYTDNSTLDIGSTTAVTASVSIVTSQAQFNIQTTNAGWTIKSQVTYL
jgi:hypothetical protein